MTSTGNRSLDDDPAFRAGVVDLLGVLGLGELTAFDRMAADSGMAPTLGDKASLAGMAVAEFHHYERIRDRLAALGVSADEAMAPFQSAYEHFHANTAPSDWLEGLVKAYVGDGIAADFYREVAETVDPVTRDLVRDVLEDTGHSDFVVHRVRDAVDADPRLSGRLALWARRLVGEALAQAQRVAVDHDALAGLVTGADGRDGLDLAELGELFTRLTKSHTDRLARLGLSS